MSHRNCKPQSFKPWPDVIVPAIDGVSERVEHCTVGEEQPQRNLSAARSGTSQNRFGDETLGHVSTHVMCKESRERCHLLRLEWANITPKNTEVLPAGTCSHSEKECQCQCARPAKYIWIELHFDTEFVIFPFVVWLRSVLVLSNNNSIPCMVVCKQQMSENLLLLRRHMKQASNPLQHTTILRPMDLPLTFLWLLYFLCLLWPTFVVQVCITRLAPAFVIITLPRLYPDSAAGNIIPKGNQVHL